MEIKSHSFNFINLKTNYSNERFNESLINTVNFAVSEFKFKSQLEKSGYSSQKIILELNLTEKYFSNEQEYLDHLSKFINKDLPENLRKNLVQILKENDVFSKHKFDVGTISDVKCDIPFIESYAPPFSSPYPFSNIQIKNILTDRYPNFNENSFQKFLKRKNINHVQIPNNIPERNGLVERVKIRNSDKSDKTSH